MNDCVKRGRSPIVTVTYSLPSSLVSLFCSVIALMFRVLVELSQKYEVSSCEVRFRSKSQRPGGVLSGKKSKVTNSSSIRGVFPTLLTLFGLKAISFIAYFPGVGTVCEISVFLFTSFRCARLNVNSMTVLSSVVSSSLSVSV